MSSLPAVALTLGIAILGESTTWTLPIGAALILLGVALVHDSSGQPMTEGSATNAKGT